MTWNVRLYAAAAALAIALLASTGAADAATFSAHGSVKQVYVTGLAPGARMALLNASGKRVTRKRADAQGGLLFRGVKPGAGYSVRLEKGGEKSGPLTVLSTKSQPPSTDVYNQSI